MISFMETILIKLILKCQRAFILTFGRELKKGLCNKKICNCFSCKKAALFKAVKRTLAWDFQRWDFSKIISPQALECTSVSK